MDQNTYAESYGEGFMIELHLLTKEERQLYFQEAAAELNIPFAIIEKDFWVVWTLHRLFNIDELAFFFPEV